MATTTPNLILRKPAGTDLINVTTDISDNMDKIDVLGAEWVDFVPTWTNSVSAPSLGNGTLYARYRKIGKTVYYRVHLKAGTTTSFGGAGGLLGFTFPWVFKTAKGDSWGQSVCVDASVATYCGICLLGAASSSIAIFTHLVSGARIALSYVSTTVPFTFGNLDEIYISGVVEVD